MEPILYTAVATYFVSRLAILAGISIIVYMALNKKLVFSRDAGVILSHGLYTGNGPVYDANTTSKEDVY